MSIQRKVLVHLSTESSDIATRNFERVNTLLRTTHTVTLSYEEHTTHAIFESIDAADVVVFVTQYRHTAPELLVGYAYAKEKIIVQLHRAVTDSTPRPADHDPLWRGRFDDAKFVEEFLK